MKNKEYYNNKRKDGGNMLTREQKEALAKRQAAFYRERNMLINKIMLRIEHSTLELDRETKKSIKECLYLLSLDDLKGIIEKAENREKGDE